MRVISFVFAVLAVLCTLAGCGPGQAGDARPVVVSTIFAYYDAARAIAGDKARAEILLPAGPSPHDYSATSLDKAKVYSANLYIKNGLNLDDRFDGLLGGSKATVLTVGTSINTGDILKTEEIPLNPGEKAPDEDAAGNPHIWLDPQIQMVAAEKIRDAMATMDPADAPTFKANAEKYLADLRQLDADFAEAAKHFKTREFIGFHSAYAYLAHRYGLQQIASIEEIPGSGLTVAQIENLVKLIQDKHIRYVAVETAFSASALDKIRERTGVQTIVLQPLETYDNLNNTYAGLMRQNLEALKKALN